MEKIQLNYQHDSSVAQIILSAPKGNVLDSIMMKELTAVLIGLKSQNNLKAVTIEGGYNFSFWLCRRA
jgi:enoyl-CoA hydratase/carnithine racemase